MGFLSFLARPGHLQLLSDEDYKKLIKEMPAALDVLYGNNKGRILPVGIFHLFYFCLDKDINHRNEGICQNLSMFSAWME